MKNTELILALDVENLSSAENLLSKFKGIVKYYKVGSSLFTLEGPKVIDIVHKYGGKVFLDLKFHDIPNTVKNAVMSAQKLGVYALSLHISGGVKMLEVCASLDERPKLWGISVLTSFDEESFALTGFRDNIASTMDKFSDLGVSAGLNGLVCSGFEIEMLRKKFPEDVDIVVPGIRLGNADDDQKRIITPKKAKELGADFIVVGRPILKSQKPEETVKIILKELE
ncbi:MAG: orotidine-5'-phosphate decarboxylase [Elusimicrobiales bacterium]|nr:orotidine-5'-phosphate decarboxylase [Elusimicrobiales bacterium]